MNGQSHVAPWIRAMGLIAAALVSATGCVGAIPGPTQIGTPGTLTATAPALTAPQEMAGLVATNSITDPKADLVDQNDKKAPRTPHVDLIALAADADGRDLRLTLTMAGTIREFSSIREELNYLVELEVDNSGGYDYWITLNNLESGEWSVAYTDWSTGQTYHDAEYPGSFTVTDNVMTLTIPLTALGSPSSMRLHAVTQLADHETGDVLASDSAPKGRIGGRPDTWLTLGSE